MIEGHNLEISRPTSNGGGRARTRSKSHHSQPLGECRCVVSRQFSDPKWKLWIIWARYWSKKKNEKSSYSCIFIDNNLLLEHRKIKGYFGSIMHIIVFLMPKRGCICFTGMPNMPSSPLVPRRVSWRSLDNNENHIFFQTSSRYRRTMVSLRGLAMDAHCATRKCPLSSCQPSEKTTSSLF